MKPELLRYVREMTARKKAGLDPLPPFSCKHKGALTGEKVPCKACGGREEEVELLSCAKHGKCTERRLVSQIQCCRICPDRELP